MASSSLSTSIIDARINTHSLSPAFMSQIAAYTTSEGQSLQKQIADEVQLSNCFGKRVGWKCGATNDKAQLSLKCDGPFFGPLYTSHVLFASPAEIDFSSFPSIVAVEAEYCIHMKSACPMKDTPYTEDELWEKVDYISSSIEIAATRLSGVYSAGAIIADFAWNGAIIVGDKISPGSLGIADLVDSDIQIFKNGESVALGKGSNVLQGPISSLKALVNALIESGECLQEGDIVMTGAACVEKNILRGDSFEVRLSLNNHVGDR